MTSTEKIKEIRQRINNAKNNQNPKEDLIELCNWLLELIAGNKSLDSVNVTDGIYVDGTKVVKEQQSTIDALTDTSTGIKAGGIIDATATYNQAIINANNATMVDKINELTALLKTHGLIAS